MSQVKIVAYLSKVSYSLPHFECEWACGFQCQGKRTKFHKLVIEIEFKVVEFELICIMLSNPFLVVLVNRDYRFSQNISDCSIRPENPGGHSFSPLVSGHLTQQCFASSPSKSRQNIDCPPQSIIFFLNSSYVTQVIFVSFAVLSSIQFKLIWIQNGIPNILYYSYFKSVLLLPPNRPKNWTAKLPNPILFLYDPTLASNPLLNCFVIGSLFFLPPDDRHRIQVKPPVWTLHTVFSS